MHESVGSCTGAVIYARLTLVVVCAQDCLRALLAVLMNMTQNNPVGCEAVVAVGALEAASPILSQIVQGGPRNRGALL